MQGGKCYILRMCRQTDTAQAFSCTMCGDCCSGNQIVWLNEEDLALICRHLGLSQATELRAAGLIEYAPHDAGFERARIRFRTRPFKACPFLQNELSEQVAGTGQSLPGGWFLIGRCSLHPVAKPLVCHLAPWARLVTNTGNGSFHETWSVQAPSEACPGMHQGPVCDLEHDTQRLRERLDAENRWMQRMIAKHTKSAKT